MSRPGSRSQRSHTRSSMSGQYRLCSPPRPTPGRGDCTFPPTAVRPACGQFYPMLQTHCQLLAKFNSSPQERVASQITSTLIPLKKIYAFCNTYSSLAFISTYSDSLLSLVRAEDFICVPLCMTSHHRTYFFSAPSYSVLFFFPVSRWGEIKIRRLHKGRTFSFSLGLCLFNLGSKLHTNGRASELN